MDFQRLDPKTAPSEGNYSLALGDSQDYFGHSNSFSLEGYLFFPANPKALVVLHSDIFSVGSGEFAMKFGESLKSKGIAVLTYDNSGSKDFGGKSDGEIRDYLLEQMTRDLHQAVQFITLMSPFENISLYIAGFSYGSVPITLSVGGLSTYIDGAILLSPPESGKDFYELYLKTKIKEEVEKDMDKIVRYEINGKNFELSKLFFNEKRMMMNLVPIIEIVYYIYSILNIPVRLIYARKDEVLGEPKVNGEEPFKVIEDATHDFSNKWEEMISSVVDFIDGVQ